MPPLKINTPQSGGIALLQWLNEPSNITPVVEVADLIVPVQEMGAMQGKWFYFNSVLSVPLNDFFSWRVDCPEDQSWRIDRIVVQHAGAASLEFTIDIPQANVAGVTGITTIFRDDVAAGTPMLLYPVSRLQGDVTRANTFEYIGQGLIVLPQEALRIVSSLIPDAGGNEISVTVRYEQVPPPVAIPRISAIVPLVEAL